MKNYQFLGKTISGPFTIPSGVVATKVSVLEKIAWEVPAIGILTTKSIGFLPREGNKEPIIAQSGEGSFINAVGLANPGKDQFAKDLANIQLPPHKFLLASIFGKDEEEFYWVALSLKDFVDGFELNISCPHSQKYGQVVGADKKLLRRIIKKVAAVGKPVMIKLSPSLNIEETVRISLDAEASGFVAINTKGPEKFFHDGYPVLSNKVGGISGKNILKLGIDSVRRVRKLTNAPLIGCGGISEIKDVLAYQRAGADFFGVGSALAGLSTEEIKTYFSSLLTDLETGNNKAKLFLSSHRLNMDYLKAKMKRKRVINSDLAVLEINRNIQASPGQFIFTWLPGKGEKPFAVFDNSPLTLLVKKRGFFSKQLTSLQTGDELYFRGPYGNSPQVSGKILLVGGGSGIASLYLFAKHYPQTIALLGSQDREDLLYDKFHRVCQKVYVVTETGKVGFKGQVTDYLEEIIQKTKPDYCLSCGPNKMIEKILEMSGKRGDFPKMLFGMEFPTHCGIGLCGSCATEAGYRSCVDGIFLSQKQIKKEIK